MKTKHLLMTLLLASVAGGVCADDPPAGVRNIIETRCAICHGREGESANAIYPRLAAQHPDYMVKQLMDFRDGRRKGSAMPEMAKDLTDPQIKELAAWFSARASGFKKPRDADLAGVGRYLFTQGNPYSGVAACVSCHGENGHGTQALPRLAGQHPAYLETQLEEFGKRARTNDNAIMHTIASKLTELERHAVAAYIGGLQ